MPSQTISDFLLSKGTLGFVCLLLIIALGMIWKVWRDDTKSWGTERAALYATQREQERENMKLIITMSDELKSVLNDIKTNLAIMGQQK